VIILHSEVGSPFATDILGVCVSKYINVKKDSQNGPTFCWNQTIRRLSGHKKTETNQTEMILPSFWSAVGNGFFLAQGAPQQRDNQLGISSVFPHAHVHPSTTYLHKKSFTTSDNSTRDNSFHFFRKKCFLSRTSSENTHNNKSSAKERDKRTVSKCRLANGPSSKCRFLTGRAYIRLCTYVSMGVVHMYLTRHG
jgi:hypothetical protein